MVDFERFRVEKAENAIVAQLLTLRADAWNAVQAGRLSKEHAILSMTDNLLRYVNEHNASKTPKVVTTSIADKLKHTRGLLVNGELDIDQQWFHPLWTTTATSQFDVAKAEKEMSFKNSGIKGSGDSLGADVHTVTVSPDGLWEESFDKYGTLLHRKPIPARPAVLTRLEHRGGNGNLWVEAYDQGGQFMWRRPAQLEPNPEVWAATLTVTSELRIVQYTTDKGEHWYQYFDKDGKRLYTKTLTGVVFEDNYGDPVKTTDLTKKTNDVILGSMTTPATKLPVVIQQRETINGVAMNVTVELHGVAVPLLALKKQLRATNITATDLANHANAVAGDAKLRSTDITAMLSGSEPMRPPVVAALQNVVFPDPDAVRNMAAKKKTGGLATMVNQMAASSKSGASAMPSFARSNATIPDDEKSRPPAQPVVGAGIAASVAQLADFPLDFAFRVQAMIRKSFHANETTATFSLRKMQMWAHAYRLLQFEGFDQKEAVAGAFHLAVSSKEYGEVRTFIENAFNQVFGHRPERPVIDPRKIATDGNRHPVSYLIEPLLRANQNVWLHGDTGAGKTHMVKSLVTSVLGREFIRAQGTRDMNTDDLLGSRGASNGSTFFEYGPLPMAMGHVDGKGKVLILDEATVTPSEVLMELQAVLEGDALVIKKNKGERIVAKPGFCVVVCDNTLGLGEKSAYIGTQPINEAFRDRFFFVDVDYMPEAQEKAIVTNYLNGLTRPMLVNNEDAA